MHQPEVGRLLTYGENEIQDVTVEAVTVRARTLARYDERSENCRETGVIRSRKH